ncbi:universal stress protein [Pusillimonas minor]|uniref:Universal stress protein n=1 Tax=Pusillimonas minor TaxID=2697024 RepID=A0A842HPU1_9BURK|nr:universal stress protein [Pusillimonas minor]MBC2769330.1 universal stress protein [Pusillimonas minor]
MLGRIAIDLTKDNNQVRRLETTLRLAKTHNAEVVGVYPSPEPSDYLRDGSLIPREVSQMMTAHLAQERDEMKALFEDQAAAAGVKAIWRNPKGLSEDVLALHARYCDLVVMSQTVKQTSSVRPSIAEAVITSAGRPVLMVPYIGEQHPVGSRILVCWDHGRRAARAFADAAPILANAKEIVIVSIDERSNRLVSQDVHEEDIEAYCVSKGYVKPRRVRLDSADAGIGNTILNAASDHGSDLIVMGAYNRSRAREWMLGGTSKTLLDSMTVPILFSH